MIYGKQKIVHKARPGGWLPQDPLEIERWRQKLKKLASERALPWIPPIVEFKQMVDSDPVLSGTCTAMFAEAYRLKKYTPLGWQPEPETFDDFLNLLNQIMFTAPEAYQTGSAPNQQPAGLIGFPINALLDWPMGTTYGYDFFSNTLVNQQFKKILNYWSNFLVTPDSRYVLTQDDPASDAIAWLSPTAQSQMVNVAYSALGQAPNPIPPNATFAQIFNCDPNAPYYGFTSWDSFFTRTFRPNMRPVDSPNDPFTIVNACESGPLTVKQNVALSDTFWIKEQPYSLENMLNWDPYTQQFVGGTVYQAFLSALSYHRWHAPVSGTIDKAYVVGGTYYLENIDEGFQNPEGADPSAPNDSQKFISSVATRALMFIRADNPGIGLMCVVAIGMAEVSSCEITAKVGSHVNKGDQLGMFHFGGSTHCLVFRPGVNLVFDFYGETPGVDAPNNIRVNTRLALLK
jgi:phosphatidylserine decarboxylase